MELAAFCEFAEIARLGSYSRAAEELHLSQSSLSKHIMALEKELGVRLFDRTSRKVTLSQAGERFLPLAQQAQDLYRTIQRTAQEEQSLRSGQVRIASIPVMAQYGITGVIADFGRAYPEAALEVRERESRDIPELLGSGECELAFTRGLENSPELEVLPFRRDRLVAALPKDHPLAGQETVTLPELEAEDFLLLDSGTSLYALCVELCRKAGFEPKVRYTGHRPENILSLAASGMGVALLMARHTTAYHCEGVAVVPVAPEVPSDVCLVRRREGRLSRYAQAFWNFLKDYEAGESGPLT